MNTSAIQYLNNLAGQRNKIYYTILAFVVVTAICTYILPPTYEATAVLMPPLDQSAGLLSLAMGSLGIAGGPSIGGVGYMPGMTTPSDIYAQVAQSRTVAEKVVHVSDLISHYKKAKQYRAKPAKTMERILEQLKKASSIAVSDKGFIVITVKDRNSEKAAQIANAYGYVLDSVNTSLSKTQGRKAREFIEGRLADEATFLRMAEDSLKSFQVSHRTISLEEEMKASVDIAAKLEAQAISQKVALEVLRTYSTDESPEAVNIRNRIAVIEGELQRMTRGTGKHQFTPLSQAPIVAMELARRMRDLKIHEEVFTLLTQQIEQAKILEAKDTPTVQFLEIAQPQTVRSWPRRKVLVLGAAVIGFCCGLSWIIALTWWSIFKEQNKYYPIVLDALQPFVSDAHRLQRTVINALARLRRTRRTS